MFLTVIRRKEVVQDTMKKGPKRCTGGGGREVLTAVEHHDADLKAHGFDPQLLPEERFGGTKSLGTKYYFLRVSVLCS